MEQIFIHDSNLYKIMEEPVVLKSKVRLELTEMKRNKAVGPDKTVIEMLIAIDCFKINKFTEMINEKKTDKIL